MSTNLEIQRCVEVPRVFMNLPETGGMGDDGERRTAPLFLD